MDFLERYRGTVHWLPRIALAGIFLFHGFIKFPMAQMMAEGMGMPVAMVYMLALMEISAGALIIVGPIAGMDILTRIAGALIALVMFGAIAMVHAPQWNFMASEAKPMGGMEFQLLTAFIAIYFLVKGNDND